MKILKIKNNFYKNSKKFYGMGSFHSKYVIVGCGYSGYSLVKFLTQVEFIIISLIFILGSIQNKRRSNYNNRSDS